MELGLDRGERGLLLDSATLLDLLVGVALGVTLALDTLDGVRHTSVTTM